MVAVTWQFRQREGHCNVLLTSAYAQYNVSRLQQHSSPASLPRLLQAVAYQLSQAVASRWAEIAGWASPGAHWVLSRLLKSGRASLGSADTPRASPACAGCFSASWGIQTRLEMNVTATMGVNLCWADEVKTPTPLHALPQQCVEQWPVFLFSRQVQFSVTSKGC